MPLSLTLLLHTLSIDWLWHVHNLSSRLVTSGHGKGSDQRDTRHTRGHKVTRLGLLSASLVTHVSVHHAFDGSSTGFTSSRFSWARHAIRMEWELTAPSPAEEVRKSQTKVAPYVRLLWKMVWKSPGTNVNMRDYCFQRIFEIERKSS